MAKNNAVATWNANAESDLAGYRVYYGLYPGTYIGYKQVGLVTTTTLQAEFTADGRWYFAISAFDTTGNESPLSAAQAKYITRTSSFLIRRK